ncbi:hypothetical protein L3Q82_019102, partial [Scortum barcoo]
MPTTALGSEATGFSPYYLLFGRTPRLPIDILFNLPPREQQVSYTEYVPKWQTRMKEAYEIASTTAQKEAAKGKRYYDQKVYGVQLHPGNRVLLRNLKERGGPGKLRSHWEDAVYVVMSQKNPDMPVYEIKPENGGKSRTVHRNLLLPCDSFTCGKAGRKRARQKEEKSEAKQERSSVTAAGTTDVDSEDEGELVWRFSHQHEHDGSVTTKKPNIEPCEQQVEEPGKRGNQPDLQGVGEERLELQGAQDHLDQQEQQAEYTSDEEKQRRLSGDSDGEQGSSPQVLNSHPQRERRRPRMLTYDALGQPTVRQVGVDRVEVSEPAPRYQRLFELWLLSAGQICWCDCDHENFLLGDLVFFSPERFFVSSGVLPPSDNQEERLYDFMLSESGEAPGVDVSHKEVKTQQAGGQERDSQSAPQAPATSEDEEQTVTAGESRMGTVGGQRATICPK